MLILSIEETMFNDETQEFIEVEPFTLELEHSLISLSKWESVYEKAFLGPQPKTKHETFQYIRFMHHGPEPLSEEKLTKITPAVLAQINDYIDSKQTATSFREMPGNPRSQEVVTSELIYYWLIAYQIPFDVETWHLNRLLALLRICNIKNSGKKEKKIPRHEVAQQNRDLNAKRKAELNTTG